MEAGCNSPGSLLAWQPREWVTDPSFTSFVIIKSLQETVYLRCAWIKFNLTKLALEKKLFPVSTINVNPPAIKCNGFDQFLRFKRYVAYNLFSNWPSMLPSIFRLLLTCATCWAMALCLRLLACRSGRLSGIFCQSKEAHSFRTIHGWPTCELIVLFWTSPTITHLMSP